MLNVWGCSASIRRVTCIWAPTSEGRRQRLKKVVGVVTKAQLKPEGKRLDGNTGVCFTGRGTG